MRLKKMQRTEFPALSAAYLPLMMTPSFMSLAPAMMMALTGIGTAARLSVMLLPICHRSAMIGTFLIRTGFIPPAGAMTITIFIVHAHACRTRPTGFRRCQHTHTVKSKCRHHQRQTNQSLHIYHLLLCQYL